MTVPAAGERDSVPLATVLVTFPPVADSININQLVINYGRRKADSYTLSSTCLDPAILAS